MKKTIVLSALLWLTASNADAQICAAPCDVRTAAENTQQRVGIAFSGGNPVLGAASTLGMRLGTFPRVTAAIRMTAVQLDIPDAFTSSATDELSSLPRTTNIDAAVGVFSGLSLVPTVGGFGSIDLLASYGKISLSDDDGYAEDPASWGGGVRVGILRESFTAPGVAVSAMYRRIGDMSVASGSPSTGGGSVTHLDNNSAISLRGTVGKRILMLGAVAGIGYDRYSSDVRVVSSTPTVSDDITTSTTTLFANLSWTMLVLHIVGEGGIQRGDNDNAYYGSLAVRLAL